MPTVEFIVAALLLLPGLGLVFIPGFPSISYMTIVVTLYAFIGNFQRVSVGEWFIFVFILALAILVDWLAGMLGAKYGGATRKAIMWGLIGMIVGLILYPPIGAYFGMFLGIFIFEFFDHNNHIRALKAAGSSILGVVAGTLVNFALAILFLVLFLVLGY